MKKMLLLCTLLVLSSCKYGKFTIKKGKHYAGFNFAAHSANAVNFKFHFDESAIYQTQDPLNQADINKLYGFSDCMTHHHKNSARVGWRWLNGQIEIMAYTYANGERSSQYITSVTPNEVADAMISIAGNSQYLFEVKGVQVYMPRGCNKESAVNYVLFPYFGGDETAPHNITIEVLNNTKSSTKLTRLQWKKLKTMSKTQYID